MHLCQVQLPSLQEVTAYIRSVYNDGVDICEPNGPFTVDGIHRLIQLYGLLELKKVQQYPSESGGVSVCVRNLC